jgi:DNA-binding transcriptional LysR family regulator
MATGRFDFHQLRCFIAVAEELSFRRAAERMNTTQPTLSRQIQELEHSVGLTLFTRTNRSVRLTLAGQSFLRSATDLLERSEAAVLTARQAERGEVGAIALGFVPYAGLAFVPKIVEAINNALPNVTFEPTEMMGYEIMEALVSGRLDLGLSRATREAEGIENLRIVSEAFVLAIPRSHPFASRPKVDLKDLDRSPFIGYSIERGPYLQNVQFGLFASANIVPRVVQSVSQTTTILGLVNQGIAPALVPSLSRVVQMDNVVYRDIETPSRFHSTLYLSFARHRLTTLHRRVIDVIVQVLAPFNAAQEVAAPERIL